jgi:hypothetical protein
MISRSLVTSTETLFPNSVTFTGSGAEDMDVSWWGSLQESPQICFHFHFLLRSVANWGLSSSD